VNFLNARATITVMNTTWLELDGTANARVVVRDVLLRSDNLQDLSETDVRVLLEEQKLEAVLDLRTEVEVQMEGPGPLTREPAVRIEHRSLYPVMGNTDLDLEPGTVNPWGTRLADGQHPEETPVVRAYMRYMNNRPDSIVAAIQTIARADSGGDRLRRGGGGDRPLHRVHITHRAGIGGGGHRRVGTQRRRDCALTQAPGRSRRLLQPLAPLGELLVGDLKRHPPVRDVDRDRVAVLDQRDRAAGCGLRRDVADRQAGGAAGEATVGDQRAGLAESRPLR
jgi:hypothetical protein